LEPGELLTEHGEFIPMTKVLFINHRIKLCGVQQFYKRVFDLVKESAAVEYIYLEAESIQEYISAINYHKPDYVVYNWHRGTMPWLSEEDIVQRPEYKHYFMFHEEFVRKNYDKYLFFGDYDFSGGTIFGDKKVLLPRPILVYDGDYPVNKVVTIGSFGFGFWQKGFHKLTKLVNDSFAEAHIKLLMPYSHFGDPLKKQNADVEAACRSSITNKGITLSINHDFISETGVLSFLAGNDINVFMYDENGEGISSVIDYALSVKRPIAISDSKMFRHIANDDILLSKRSIMDILNNGVSPLESYYDKWSVTNFKTSFDKEFV
jgi:hypothetical protein